MKKLAENSMFKKTKIMASGPMMLWQTDGETMETVTGFTFLGSRITVEGDCSHKIKRCVFLGRKFMANLDSVLQSRDISFLAEVHLVKTKISLVVMYGYES